jgi:hypothetical protein
MNIKLLCLGKSSHGTGVSSIIIEANEHRKKCFKLSETKKIRKM